MTTVIVNAGNPTATVNNPSVATATVEKIKTVTVLDEKVKVVSLGIVGPQGPQGPSGAGSVTVGETEPPSPLEGDQWLVSSTGVLSVYANSTWEPVVYKSELTSDAGELDTNGGYF